MILLWRTPSPNVCTLQVVKEWESIEITDEMMVEMRRVLDDYYNDGQ